ncbi:MAG: peptidyl-prolyl cis-trans isomerase [Bacteroidota bacterium]
MEPEKIVARVGEKILSEQSMLELTPTNLSTADSTTFAEKFVTDWIKKQLMIQKAAEAIDFNEAQIQSKVLDYQYALMVHELEERYIDTNLDKEVTELEIEKYYTEKSENFILRQNLAKCLYFKIPNTAPQIWQLKKSIRNYLKDKTKILEYANKHAVKSFTEDSVWIKFDDVLLETPLREVTDKTQLLKTKSSIEVSDEDFVYFLKIIDYKLIGEIAPVEFISENVKDVIINKRKIALKKELEKKIYDEAVQSNAFEIYSD